MQPFRSRWQSCTCSPYCSETVADSRYLYRPVGTRCFNSSNQLRMTNLWGKAPRYVCNSRVVAATWDGLDVLLARLCTYFCFVARKPE